MWKMVGNILNCVYDVYSVLWIYCINGMEWYDVVWMVNCNLCGFL